MTDSLVAGVELAIARAGAFGVDREQLTGLDYFRGVGKCPERLAAAVSLHRDHAERREQPAGLPVVEVLGLPHESDAAARRQHEGHRVEERDVDGSDDGASGPRDVCIALDGGRPQQRAQPAEKRPGSPIQAPLGACLLGRDWSVGHELPSRKRDIVL